MLNNILGDSDEKSTVLSLTQRSERTPLTYSQSGNAILNTWRNQSLYNTTGLEVKTIARVYVNLELSVSEILIII